MAVNPKGTLEMAKCHHLDPLGTGEFSLVLGMEVALGAMGMGWNKNYLPHKGRKWGGCVCV